MVMDATPSPQSVGREFVRQYYTLLNKAPNHLHRFYNNHSSFVHGGLDQHNRDAPIVVGQKCIHNKIQQLNFRDCHAKISQVDSQATLGNGVVVQVTGELSNDGQPMRRFTQTFVLAAQTPKKYYVHNDIFRYQDFYSDDEVDVESGGRSENDEELQDVSESIDTTPINSHPPQIFYPLGVVAAATIGQTIVPPPFAAQPAANQMNGAIHEDLLQNTSAQSLSMTSDVTQQTHQMQADITPILMEPIVPSPPPTVSASIVTPPSQATQYVEEIVENPILTKINENVSVAVESNPIVENEADISINSVKNMTDIMNEESALKAATVVTNEPKTYANLVKSGVTGLTFASAMASSPSSIVSGNSTRQNTLSPPPIRFQSDDHRRSDGPQSQRPSNRPMHRGADRERRSSNANNQFGDSHQLFVGNVPHHATEDELRALFSKFGLVADLRIHSKPGPKIPGGRAPPNYGFITYEDPESVQNCLANMPLYYPDNSSDGQKLNIEEKKIRSRNESGGLPNNMRGNSGGSSSRTGGGNLGGGGGGNNSSSRGLSSNQGIPRGGSTGRGSGGRGGFNRTDRGGRDGGGGGGSNGGTSNSNYNRR